MCIGTPSHTPHRKNRRESDGTEFMQYHTESIVPAYTPSLSVSAEAYGLKRKGGMLNKRIRQLDGVQRTNQWADEVTRAAAAIPLLPESVSRHFSEQALLDRLLADAEQIRAEQNDALNERAKEISRLVSANAAPELELPKSEETRFSVDFCSEGEAFCEKRISWCTKVISYEQEYFRLSENLRRRVSDIDGFAIAPDMLRAAILDKEIFGVMKTALTAPDYNWISQIALAETKFCLLTPEERENTITAPYLTKLIGMFKTFIAIEEKIDKDPAYGKHVHKEIRRCRKNAAPFIRSSVFRQCKTPPVENIFNNTDRRQCTF